ncbi:MAG: hypothetical protein ACQESE_01465 [Nanobdellota archaeon]
MSLKRILQKTVLTALTATTIGLSASYAQTDQYHMRRTDHDKEFNQELVEKAKQHDLLPSQTDSLVNYWAPLYQQTGGRSRSAETNPETIFSDTTTIERAGALGSIMTVYSNTEIMKLTTRNEITVSSYDLGSFTPWAEQYSIPDYARRILYESLYGYFNENNECESETRKDSSQEHHRTSYEHSNITNPFDRYTKIKSDMYNQYQSLSSGQEYDRDTISSLQEQSSNHPKWSLDISILKSEYSKKTPFEIGVSHDMFSISRSEGLNTVRMHLSTIINNTSVSEYETEKVINEDYRIVESETGTTSEKVVEKKVITSDIVTYQPARLLTGVRLGNANYITMSVYAGATLQSTTNKNSHERIDQYFYESKDEGLHYQRTGYEIGTEHKSKKQARTYSFIPTFKFSFDYKSIGITTTAHKEENEWTYSFGASINF